MWIKALILLVVCGSASCSSPRKKSTESPNLRFALREDDSVWKAEVESRIPVGTPISEAMQILEVNEFQPRLDEDHRGALIIGPVRNLVSASRKG